MVNTERELIDVTVLDSLSWNFITVITRNNWHYHYWIVKCKFVLIPKPRYTHISMYKDFVENSLYL